MAPLTLMLILLLSLTLLNAQCPKDKDPPAAVGFGGLVHNPDVDDGLESWEPIGSATISVGSSSGSNKFVVASNRKMSTDSLGQTLKQIEKNRLYRLTAWIRVSQGNAPVTPVFRTVSGSSYYLGELVEVGAGCWTQLKSEFSFDTTEAVVFYFESKSLVDLWADSVSVVTA